MRIVVAARVTVAAASSAIAHQKVIFRISISMCRRLRSQSSCSISDGDRHRGAPERQLFRAEARPTEPASAYASEVPKLPTDAEPVAQKSRGTTADIHGRPRALHQQGTKI